MNKIQLRFSFSLVLQVLLNIASLSGFGQTQSLNNSGTQNGNTISENREWFDKIIPKGTKINNGLFNVYKVGDHYYYEIPDSLLNRDMLVVTRMAKIPYGLSVFSEISGKQNQQVWRWERRDKKVYIYAPDYGVINNEQSAMYRSVKNSNIDAVIASFEIKAQSIDHNGVLIDVTDFYNGDTPAINVNNELKADSKIGPLDISRSYVDTIRSFPMNVEVRQHKTYRAAGTPDDGTLGAITLEMNASMLLLPKAPMKARLSDNRVAYITQEKDDYESDPQRVIKTGYAERRRLEPKDTLAYQRGELVEPKHPIVFYIDPATPSKWVPYLIAGVNDWQAAFEAAGFKNAIMGKVSPTPQEDPEFSIEDARYNVIRYYASDEENAAGPVITDPRTGEIIESHVAWFHNELKSLYDWYFIQTAATNPLARKAELDDETMGQLIRYTCAHEIGHTLGLPHNWGSSYGYSIDSLRSKTFTAKHGTAPSVMDYARFNYVAQPGDGITQFSPKIGEYDLWAIKWGYTWFPGNRTAEQEKRLLNKWTSEKTNNPLYFFGPEFTGADPRAQNEDIGDDAMRAGMLGIANLKIILPNIEKWTYQPGKDLSDVAYMYNHVLDQYKLYIGHVTTNIGGIYFNQKNYEDKGITAYAYVEKNTQRKAVNFISTQVFDTPLWLMDKKELSEFDNGLIIERIKKIQIDALSQLFNPSRLARIIDNEIKNGQNAYSINNLFDDLRNRIFSNVNPDPFQRNLQRGYLDILRSLLTNEFKIPEGKTLAQLAKRGRTPINIELSDIRPLVRAELKRIDASIPKQSLGISGAHYADLHLRIKDDLNITQTMVNLSGTSK